MAERKGVLQILDDFGFGLQRGGTVGIFLDRLSVDSLAHERTEKKMIGEADVLHLFGESAHTLKLAVCRRERILLFGHSLSTGNDLLFDKAILHVEDRGEGRRLLLGRRAALTVGGWGGGRKQEGEKHGKILHQIILIF